MKGDLGTVGNIFLRKKKGKNKRLKRSQRNSAEGKKKKGRKEDSPKCAASHSESERDLMTCPPKLK